VKHVLALPLSIQKFYKLFTTTINWLRDELDELGEGDFYRVAFNEGSGCAPRRLGVNNFCNRGRWIGEPLGGR
jgi:hypothetical protein